MGANVPGIVGTKMATPAWCSSILLPVLQGPPVLYGVAAKCTDAVCISTVPPCSESSQASQGEKRKQLLFKQAAVFPYRPFSPLVKQRGQRRASAVDMIADTAESSHHI